MKNKTGTYTHFVANTPENIRLTNAIQANFADVVIKITNELIIFETPSHVTIVSIRAAFN